MLHSEFLRRRQGNPRYSLRAFARFLGTDHSTLSQIFRNRRNLSPEKVRLFGTRLRIDLAIIADACAQQDAEAIMRLARTPAFCTHSRWIATRTGIPLDAVNATLHRLLNRRNLVMKSANHWKITQTSHA